MIQHSFEIYDFLLPVLVILAIAVLFVFAIIPLAAAVMLLVHRVGERRRAARREASKATDGAEPANVP